MPLIKSKSKSAFSDNIAELINSFKKKGRIGNSKPANVNNARKQALAIAFKMKRGAQ
jgi:predicted CopG family antitoxin